MGRPLRIKAPDVTYHITSRTNGKRLCMKKSKDRKALCCILQKIKLKYGAKIYGFTPMSNHFHLILKLNETGDLSQFMCEFKTAYAKYYNVRYNISGHFWGDRFRSTIIQEDQHMLACLRYIDRNPMKARLVKRASQWIYGSYGYYALGKKHEILELEHHPTYLELSANEEKRYEIYIDYVKNKDELSDRLHGSLDKLLYFGSQEFVTSFR